MACLKVDDKSKDKTSISIILFVRLFLVGRVPFCLLNDAVLVEGIRQGRRI